METMESSSTPPRRRATFSSLQLQRAADQLQDAIQSVRQRRSMCSSNATSLSLLSESSDEDDGDEDHDQENRPLNGHDHSAAKGVSSSTRPEKGDAFHTATKVSNIAASPLRRYTLDHLASSGGRREMDSSLTLKDLYASPVRLGGHGKHQSTVFNDMEAIPLTDCSASVGDQMKSMMGCGASGPLALPSPKNPFDESSYSVDNQTRKALQVVQHEVESQARANRELQEQLKRVVDEIGLFVNHTVAVDNEGKEAKEVKEPWSSTGNTRILSPEMVTTMSNKWLNELEKWKNGLLREKRDADEKVALLEVEMQKTTEEMQTSSDVKREEFHANIAFQDREIEALNESHKASALAKQEQQSISQALRLENDQIQMENEDLRMHLVRDEATEAKSRAEEQQEQQQQREVLNLLAQLKQTELRELQWEVAFEDQSQAVVQAQERVAMLLEDNRQRMMTTAAAVVTPVSAPVHPQQTRRESFASSTTSSELLLYQQRIEFLEEQLRDVKAQIHCDHTQFLYEQEKWQYEKKHMGNDVNEVHETSVKVLKLLLLREKLLKRQETKLHKRCEKQQTEEASLQAKWREFHAATDTAMEECAVALLYVRQLAISVPTDTPPTADRLPVKPIKLVRLLKRLKRLQEEAHSNLSSIATNTDGHSQSSTRSSTSTCAGRAATPHFNPFNS